MICLFIFLAVCPLSRQSLIIVFYRCILWIHDNNSCLTIKSDTGQHLQFLQMFSYLLMNDVRECKSINSSPCPTYFDVPHVTYDMWNVMWLTCDIWHVTFDMWHLTCDVWHVMWLRKQLCWVSKKFRQEDWAIRWYCEKDCMGSGDPPVCTKNLPFLFSCNCNWQKFSLNALSD